jgi:hypothetical protein
VFPPFSEIEKVQVPPELAGDLFRAAEGLPLYDNKEFYSPDLQLYVRDDPKLDQGVLNELRMQFVQIRDRVKPEPEDGGPIDLSALAGDWVNSNPDTNGVARMVITQSGDGLSLRVHAVGPQGLIDWGPTRLNIFTSTPASRIPTGFTCVYVFGFAETRLQAMILKGLIVLGQIHRFKDDSNRVDYFVREYFALDHGRY